MKVFLQRVAVISIAIPVSLIGMNVVGKLIDKHTKKKIKLFK